ncbi:PREDICTED: endoribonuclease Dicer [Trachymyrmex septentrionalis]|uniref:endoribonuclease Dicer n=1 Tax=Trachymyrmex septentrionalis TaxID=34720 RepID=UPI00084F57A3|nr:PREDICTED: endoribonuclease Dicer [Trachymyrmex septentrionalis]XP_018354964.1 PREDICTED: endoribonuclease Dicer [Trachymyrmex septentrionalis]XP_018354965.1 PREDICTED: endoribonuclease Dicer [Trachymyrmex septentrionalis]XP_018354966.1 PREDICTED: endoribonuclease Dicer [Trachymyrmex septentrionalis]XP_018354968.1 PREDICTED: endoribonuclease Dicer [Trachymyrmex septentrionalis]
MEPKIISENKTVIPFKPRAYQIDLYERAVQNNLILYLPTGAGKTYIAVMLMKHLSRDIRKPYQEGGKRTIFVVNTVALVEQQSTYIKRHTDLRCKGYSGDMKVDFWSEQQWITEIEEHEVLVMTSQIFLNLLIHAYIILDRINLIMFDECHRAVDNHPMRQIMQQFENCSKEQHPRVLAMSATLLNANIKADKIESTIKDLEITFHAKIATVESTDSIQGCCTNPNEEIVKYSKYLVPEVVNKINDIIKTTKEVVNNIKLNFDEIYKESSEEMRPKPKSSKLMAILNDIGRISSQTGIYCGNKSALLHLIQLESLRKYSDDQMTNALLDYLITQVMLIRKLFDNEMKGCIELDRLFSFSCNQIQKLFEILLKYYNNLGKEFCCIIFVKERFMTQVIYHVLKTLSAHDRRYNFLQPDYVIGFQNNPYKNTREVSCIAKWNKEVLQRLKNGSSNCIVATDVVDEGIDIATCTLIIRYDVPADFRAYVQSKGRARHNLSSYLILVENDDEDFLKKYYQYKDTEKKLKRILIGKNERPLPTQDDIVNGLYSDFDIEPYTVKRDNVVESRLTEFVAIDLINIYCAALLTSKFVNLVPIWKLDKDDFKNMYRISLKLPNLSPLKDVIYGDFMKSINGAKRSVAMKTCIQLHKLGALTDKLLPATNEELTKNLDFLFPNWINDNGYLCGTYKRKREHQLEYPLAFYGAYPQPLQLLYLHVFDCTSICPVMGYDNRRVVFYNLLNDKSGFGILSTKSLPKIPSFPIFMKDGKLNVNVKSDHATMVLSQNEIELLRRFNFLLFNEIIPVIKSFMIFDNDNLENSFVIVPLNDKQEINWEIIETYQDLERIIPNIPFHFRTSNYELALVTPSYRYNAVYIVTRVCDDLTPESCFPNEDFDTYTHYYKEKHGLIIENLQQSMLEVKPIPIKINYIKPRKLPEGTTKYKKTDDTVEDLQEHLVPELCYKINFPSVYWLKATTLPSILHRICQLLVAEDLRVTIAKETGLGTLILKESSSLKIEDDVEKSNEEDYTNGLELTDDSIEKTLSDETYSDPNLFDLDCNPFMRDQEPRDLYRNIDCIQMIDIQYYNQFMSETCEEDENIKKNANKNIGHYIGRSVISSTPSLSVLTSSDEPSFSQGPNSTEIVYALTTKLGSDMFNLERLETLGDSYLKFIVSLFLYHRFPTFNEGQLTALKGKMIGNRNLYYCGNKKGIPGRIKNDAFVPKSNFIPPAYSVYRPLQKILTDESVAPNVLYEFLIPTMERFTGYISEDTLDMMKEKVLKCDKEDDEVIRATGVEHYLGIQVLSDKTVADSVEALIGVYLKSNHIKGAAKLLKWFGILPDVSIDKLLDSISQDPVIGVGDLDYHMPWADTLESKIGYKFKNRAFLLQAFTHPSYTANGITECYQRLEFLGDAIIDFLITCYIYENGPNLSPGDLTDLRSALVNNITFACLSVRHGLHTALLTYAPKLHEIIDCFVRFQEERDYVVNDELLYVLIEEDECNLTEYVDVPKVLGDLFESLIGAIYLDSGKNLTKTWEIIYSFMHKEIDEFSRNIPKQPIRVIYENTDIRPKFLEATLIKGTSTVMVPLKITIAGKEKLFYGFGVNKKQAKCAAAKQALKRLQLEK